MQQRVNHSPITGGTSSNWLLDTTHQQLDRRCLLKQGGRTLAGAAGFGVAQWGIARDCFSQTRDDASAKNSSDDQADNDSRNVSEISFRDETNEETAIQGRVLVRAKDCGLLVEDAAQRLWTIVAERLENETRTDQAFEYFSADQLAGRLIDETKSAGINAEFQVSTTDHYVIAASTPEAYSQWTSRLLERMQLAFQSYWKNRQFELHSPAAPLPVLILSNQAQFAKMAQFDQTPASANGQGYYLVTANRVVLFDLTAANADAPAETVAEVQRRVQQVPASAATVVHEATHQIAFNRGMHRRYADNPIWLTEGMAMYFEAPDLRSRRGWSTIGKVNAARLYRFRDFLKGRREPDSLETLIQSNSRFADAEQAADAYSEAWALTYFLIRTRIRDYTEYLKAIAQKRPLQWDTPAERLAEFQTAFGSDLSRLGRDLLKFIHRLR